MNDKAFFQFGAGNEIRTRDPNLGKVVLYQLSYSRVEVRIIRMDMGAVKQLIQLISAFIFQHDKR